MINATDTSKPDSFFDEIRSFAKEHLPEGCSVFVERGEDGLPHWINVRTFGLYLGGKHPMRDESDGLTFNFYERPEVVRWLLAIVEQAAIVARRAVDGRERAVAEAREKCVDLARRAERLMSERNATSAAIGR